MQVLGHRLDFGKAKHVTLMSASCWHYGNPSVHEEGINKFMAKAKKNPWIHHGDVIEGIIPGDRRCSQLEHKETILESMARAAGIMKRAAGTCMGLIIGNHEYAPSRVLGDVTEKIAMDAGIPYRGGVCYIDMLAEGGTCRGFFAHGTGSANFRTGELERKASNRQIKLRNILQPFSAPLGGDVVSSLCGMGHMHRSIVTPQVLEERLQVIDGKTSRRPVMMHPTWYYACPSMFRTYPEDAAFTNYAEMSIYPATDLGWIETVIERSGNIACVREVYETGQIKCEYGPTIVS